MKNLPEILIDDAEPTKEEFDRMAFLGRDALKIYTRLKPFESDLEQVKKMLREEALGRKVTILVPKAGTVMVKTPPVATKPTKSLVLNHDAFRALPVLQQKSMLRRGVVRIIKTAPRVATASVSISSVSISSVVK